ncbi:MAG: class I tRNA ligase family protein, partial [Planctomycetes bacterium]|nr:class I tRNA ligase family protein [Planctomycetota bacterium]
GGLGGVFPGSWISSTLVQDGIEAKTGQPVVSVKLDADQVEKKGDQFVLKEDPSIVVESRAFKMSKSRGNVVNPDDIVSQFGADSLRMFEMFMGPLEQMKPWSMSGVEGVYRFLGRVWRMIVDERADDKVLHPAVRDVAPGKDQQRILHKTIKAVTEDIEKLSFNTAISRMMEFTNEIGGQDPRPKSVLEPFILLLSPFAPHIAEELWEVLNDGGDGEGTLAYEPWPDYDDALMAESEIEIPVQVNGKLRSKVKVPAEADQQTIQQAAESDAVVAKYLTGQTIIKVIVVPGRLVNFVVNG